MHKIVRFATHYMYKMNCNNAMWCCVDVMDLYVEKLFSYFAAVAVFFLSLFLSSSRSRPILLLWADVVCNTALYVALCFALSTVFFPFLFFSKYFRNFVFQQVN